MVGRRTEQREDSLAPSREPAGASLGFAKEKVARPEASAGPASLVPSCARLTMALQWEFRSWAFPVVSFADLF